MDRRDFLKTAALAAAAASAATNSAAQAAPARIPCGMLGVDHSHAMDVLEVLLDSPDFEVVGVAEPDEAVRKTFEAHPLLRRTKWVPAEDLLADPRVKMVAVESFVPRLLGLGRQVVDAGKHLHLDKAPGTSLPEFKALLDEAQKRDLLVQLGYMFRYNPGFDFLRKAVAEGWLGDVYYIHASMPTRMTPEKRVRSAHHPGGMMLELGSHLIDMIVLLLGAPQQVTPFLRHHADADDALADNTLAVLQYPKAMVTVETSAMEPEAFPGRRFKVCGTQGSFTLEPLEPPTGRLALAKAAGGYTAGDHEVPFEDIPRHLRDFEDLARCIRGEKPFAYSKEHDYRVQQTLLRACGTEV